MSYLSQPPGLLARLEEIPPKVRQAKYVIDTQYGSPLSLDSIAAQVKLSKFHLSRVFLHYYGMTLGNYLTSVRLEEAKRLLVSSRLPVKEIGLQVGYPNESYFSALFRRHFGCSPRDYRVQAKGRHS